MQSLIRRTLLTAVIAVAAVCASSHVRAQSAPRPRVGYVQTPSGWRHESCVHEVPLGAEVTDEADGRYAVRAAGRVVGRVDKCGFPPLTRDGREVPSLRSGAPIAPATDGWILSTEGALDPNDSIRHFTRVTSYWNVPGAPPAVWGQVVFFFNGLINACTLYQPVLQWGDSGYGGGNYWSVVNFIADSPACGADVFHGPYQRVNAGDQIKATVESIECRNDSCNWSIRAQVNANAALELRTGFLRHKFFDVVTSAMEIYGVDQCIQLPNASSLEVYNVQVWRSSPGYWNGRTQLTINTNTPAWSLNGGPNCSYWAELTGGNNARLHWSSL